MSSAEGNQSVESAEEVAALLLRVYEIHDVVIEDTGSVPGLHSWTLLHSAVARPFATFGGEELYPSDFEKAAALFHSLIKNHPFLDGTKRTAFAAALYFLEESGYTIPEHLPKDEIISFCIELAEETLREAEGTLVERKSIADIAAWFQKLLGV